MTKSVPSSRVEPTRIGIVAAPNAGVTSWLGAVAAAARRDHSDALHVHGLDAASVEYLEQAEAALQDRRPFRADSPLQDVKLHFHSNDFDADFHVIDPDGAEIERSIRRLDDDRLAPVFDHLAKCPVVWVFLDPQLDLEGEPAIHDRRQSALLTMFAERRKRGAEHAEVAVVLTKMDAHPSVRSSEQAREFAMKRQPAFFAKLGRHASRLRFFATSAFGIDGQGPIGVERVLEWTTQSIRRREGAPRRRKIAMILGAVVVAAASFVGWRMFEGDRERQVLADESLSKTERVVRTSGSTETSENSRQVLFRQRLEELASTLSDDVGEDRLRESVRELDRLRNARPGRSTARLEEVRRLAERRIEDRRLTEIRDAAEHLRPNLETLVAAFHRDFPESDRWSEVQKLQAGVFDRELQNARTAVRLTVATDAASLERKATAIRDFLLRFDNRLDESERIRMRRAAELGSRFAKSTLYRIRLKRSGNLSSPRVQHVKIVVEGNPEKAFIAPEPTTTATWDKTCDIYWQAGNWATAILVSQSKNWVNYNYYTVADRSEEGLFGLRAFSSIGPPHVPDEWRGVFSDGEAFLDLEIEGISPDDWRIASDYLSPGDKW